MTFDLTSGVALAVLLSLVSAVAYAGGAIVQERVASSSPEGFAAALRSPGWWAANGLNGTGALLHVVALAYGPLSVVQPLGALTIVFALPLVALSTGRRTGANAWRGAAMATAGLAGLLALTGSAGTGSLAAGDRLPLAVTSLAAVAALMAAGRAARGNAVVRSTLLACAAGAAYGVSSVFTKTAAVDWAAGDTTGALFTGAVILALAAAGTVASQASYRGAGLATPLAVVTVVNPVVAAVIGMALFGETFRYGALGTLLAICAGAVVAGGLTLLTQERVRAAASTAPAAVTSVAPATPAAAGAALSLSAAALPGARVFRPVPVAVDSLVPPVLVSRTALVRPRPQTVAPLALRARVASPIAPRAAYGRTAPAHRVPALPGQGHGHGPVQGPHHPCTRSAGTDPVRPAAAQHARGSRRTDADLVPSGSEA
ncbi:DMT family transporter [Streptomyces sp. NPDC000594]|uniref:DMT family transporter n=1 Tax=Streptomyces sp. NPDC000594 TaxID=3154261 RepID=UPI003325DEF7